MVTAKDGSDDVVEALDLGANDYVTKPIDFAVALARIRAQVTARRADPLTGLPNRVLFMDRLDRLLRASQATGAPAFAVLFLDVDRFKIINDSLGHAAGDELLVEIARRLEQLAARHRHRRAVRRRAHAGPDRRRRVHGPARRRRRRRARAGDRRAAARRGGAAVRSSRAARSSPRSASGWSSAPTRYQRAEDMVRDADTAMYRRQGAGQGALRGLRHLDARGGRGAAAARVGSPPRARAARAGGPLPADRRARGGAALRVRGAAALAPSRARPACSRPSSSRPPRRPA